MQRLLLQDEDVHVQTHTRALCATGCGFSTSSKVLCVIGTVLSLMYFCEKRSARLELPVAL